SVVTLRRRLEWREPDGVNAEELEIVHAVDQPLEVADAVAVRVEKRLEIEAVDHRVLVPQVFNHAGPQMQMRCRNTRRSLRRYACTKGAAMVSNALRYPASHERGPAWRRLRSRLLAGRL